MKVSPYIELFNKQLPTIPFEIQEKLSTPNCITLTPFLDKDTILRDPQLQSEAGFRRNKPSSVCLKIWAISVCQMRPFKSPT